MNTIRGKGHFKDVLDQRDYRLSDLVGAVNEQSHQLVGAVPDWGAEAPSVNLMSFVHEMKNQLNTEGCVGFAISRATHMRGLIQGYSEMKAPSEYALWALARACEKPLGQPLQNVGCQPRNACAMAMKWGLAPYAAWPADPTTMNVMPTPDVLRAASPYRAASYFDVEDADRSGTVRKSLSAGIPLCVAVQVDKTFNEFSGSHVMPEFDGTYLGSHYVVLIGYCDGAYLICNSWGSDWGMGGFAWITESRLLHPTTTDLRAVLVVPDIEAA